MANIISDKYGVYSYIGVSDELYQHNSLILDSNVAISLEKFFYSPIKLNRKLEATRDLLLDNMEIDIITGAAIQESCWDPMISNINNGQLSKLEIAMNGVLNWGEKEIIKHSHSNGIEFKGKAYREKPKNILTLVPQIKKWNPLMLGSYACVLKIMTIQKQKLSRVESVKLFVEFLIYELKAIHALEMELAVNYFLGNDDLYTIGNGIFKFDKQNEEVLLKAWNAAWDLFFLRLLQRAYSDYSFLNIIKPKLVTEDKNLIGMAKLCSLESSIIKNNHFIPILLFDETLIKKDFRDVVENINLKIKNSFLERSNARKNIKDKDSYLIEKVKFLEAELLNYCI
ncbi:hypothetical protein [Lysinibacillus varians]|uniref:Uncharacterized protein n=1 Tax=Lysinibacillus varians TaxID=1145276 RepID=A0ABY2TDJ1_9BACI|nr:hypothetical protein [Lysinibacillus varians]AHN24453.1 hypothetical protein T479_19120 [Lysinibacillus varians]TKI66457.1 hypothetical protein FC752_04220 [Lysinibacillus varians]